MDLDTVADELYGLRPREFTTARDRRAKEARAAGDRALAERIHRLRRPTTAAWAGNLLVREQHEEVEALLRLGESLRQAHQDLDGEQLRQLSAEQLRVISALGRQAQQLTADAGRRIGEGARREVEQTLHAALADPEAGREWSRGRLTASLDAPAGFPALSGLQPAPEAARGRGEDKQAREAEQEARARADDRDAARRETGAAEDRRRTAEERTRELRHALEEAERQERRARDAAEKAEKRRERAERAADEARSRAADAVDAVRRH